MAQKRAYEIPESLAPGIAVADKYGVLVTSTTGGTHNKGSKHYQKLAFDIDNRKLDANPKLKQAFFSELAALGYGYLDETKRPAGQPVWGGSHYHIQRGLNNKQQGYATAPVLPSAQPVNIKDFQQPAVVPMPLPMGNWEQFQQNFNAGKPVITPEYTQALDKVNKQKYKTEATPVKPIELKTKTVRTGTENFNPQQFLDTLWEQNKPKPIEATPAGPVEQFKQGISAPFQLYGPQTDVAARQSGSSLPYQAGNFLGAVGANLAGAGLGALGGPVGSVAGGVAAGGLLSGGQELQRQRLQGEPVSYGKAAGSATIGGGLNAIPAVGAGLKLLPRLGLNAGAQGVAQGLLSAPQQAIEQGTLTPKLDLARMGAEFGLGAAGGTVGGLMTRGAKPAPKQPRVTMAEPQGIKLRPRVQIQEPQTLDMTGLNRPPLERSSLSTLDPTNPVGYGLPDVPKVKPVEYKAPSVIDFADLERQSEKAFARIKEIDAIDPDFGNSKNQKGRRPLTPNEELERTNLLIEIENIKEKQFNIGLKEPTGPKGTDEALYDVANSTPETNPQAWAAAREALPEHGDINIQDVGKKVGEVVDALPQGEVIPENITERLVAPKSKDPIANASPRPQTPAEIVATSRKLAGTVDEMIAQGTEASPIKTREQYNNLTKAYKELYGGITRYNKDVKNGLIDLSDLTPEVMAQRGGMLNDMINTGAIIPQARIVSPKVLQDFRLKYEKMTAGLMNAGELAQMQATIADMEYRAQLQSLSDQMETIHPEVRNAWEFDVDPVSKLATQKAGMEETSRRKLVTYEAVKDSLPENLQKTANVVDEQMRQAKAVAIDADTEITGATSRVSEREVTPIGWFQTKDGHVGFTAYNNDGHLGSYYITPKMNTETGGISQVRSVAPLGSELFRGEYANVYKGPREFRIDDILQRPVRPEGVATSKARATQRKARAMFNDPELQALNPRVKELATLLDKNPNKMSIEQINQIEDLLTADKKVLQAACELLGKI